VSPKPTWINDRVDVLLAELNELGMSMSRAAAAALIRERVEWVASQMRITKASARPYLTDEAVKGLAHTIAFSVAEEAPGADVLESPRTAALPVSVVGRTVAALAEAAHLRLYEATDVEHVQATIAQLAQALSAVGQVLAEHDDTAGVAVRFPPALIHRVARHLDAAAGLALDGVLPPQVDPAHAARLAAAFTDDAGTLRGIVGE
jgi:hypothetical protein